MPDTPERRSSTQIIQRRASSTLASLDEGYARRATEPPSELARRASGMLIGPMEESGPTKGGLKRRPTQAMPNMAQGSEHAPEG